jgi:hypothetical protein
MFRRIWTPAIIEGSNNESKIEIYDFGVYCGELIGDNWTCWEILSRTKNEAGEIVEELRKMPQDWTPFEEFTRETYLGTSTTDTIRIRGWSIRTVEIPSEKVLDHHPKTERDLRPQAQQKQVQRNAQSQRKPQAQQPQRQPQQKQVQRVQQRPQAQPQAGARRTAAKPVNNMPRMKPPHRVAQVDQWTPLVNLVAPI